MFISVIIIIISIISIDEIIVIRSISFRYLDSREVKRSRDAEGAISHVRWSSRNHLFNLRDNSVVT